jgi:uncharacterized protein (TIGR02118 family)
MPNFASWRADEMSLSNITVLARSTRPTCEYTMISYFIRYRGTAPDAAGFTSYYEMQHAAVLKRFPGIRSLVLHAPTPWRDPFPVQPGGSLLLAQMVFDSPQALDAALNSTARREAREDFHRFPQFDGEVTHEAMTTRVVF